MTDATTASLDNSPLRPTLEKRSADAPPLRRIASPGSAELAGWLTGLLAGPALALLAFWILHQQGNADTAVVVGVVVWTVVVTPLVRARVLKQVLESNETSDMAVNALDGRGAVLDAAEWGRPVGVVLSLRNPTDESLTFDALAVRIALKDFSTSSSRRLLEGDRFFSSAHATGRTLARVATLHDVAVPAGDVVRLEGEIELPQRASIAQAGYRGQLDRREVVVELAASIEEAPRELRQRMGHRGKNPATMTGAVLLALPGTNQRSGLALPPSLAKYAVPAFIYMIGTVLMTIRAMDTFGLPFGRALLAGLLWPLTALAPSPN